MHMRPSATAEHVSLPSLFILLEELHVHGPWPFCAVTPLSFTHFDFRQKSLRKTGLKMTLKFLTNS